MARTHRVLLADLDERAVAGSALTLDAAARHHLGRVLRLQPGDALELIDGRGGLALARWAPGGQAVLERALRRSPPRPDPVRLAVAPPRPSRLDWLVEKATELGVAEILLLQTRHAVRAIEPKRVERLQRKVDEALLQCRRLWRPRVAASAPLERVLADHRGPIWFGQAPADETTPGAEATELPGPAPPPRPAAAPLLLVVGPEGGLDAAEQAQLLELGAQPVRCGRGVLRVETAALALAVLASA